MAHPVTGTDPDRTDPDVGESIATVGGTPDTVAPVAVTEVYVPAGAAPMALLSAIAALVTLAAKVAVTTATVPF